MPSKDWWRGLLSLVVLCVNVVGVLCGLKTQLISTYEYMQVCVFTAPSKENTGSKGYCENNCSISECELTSFRRPRNIRETGIISS